MKTSVPPPFLSIIIPAFNEGLRLARSLSEIVAFLDRHGISGEIVVIDDGSRDDTAAVAARVLDGRTHTVARNPVNRGKGYSVREGMRIARGRFVLVTDADLSTPIEEYSALAARTRDYGVDVVIGSRALPDSRIEVRQSMLRQNLGRCFNHIVRLLTGLRFSDTQCGFKLMDRERVGPLFDRMVVDGFAYDVELLFLCERRGISVMDVGVRWRNERGSKVSLLNAPLSMIADVVRMRWRDMRGRYEHTPLVKLRDASPEEVSARLAGQ